MNLLALPFYKDISRQLQHGNCAAYGTGLIGPRDRFLPFVLKRPVTGQGLDCVAVYDAHTGQLKHMIEAADFPCEVYTDGLFDYYVYYGGVIAGLNLPCGKYYIQAKSFYSEVFEVRTSLIDLLKIEWGNSSDIETIPYSQGFLQRLYLDTGLAEPSYKHDEDGLEDGDKVFTALQHRLTKTFKFDTLALPEFLIDVLTSLAVHNNVTVAGKVDMHEFEAVPTWSRDSCVALAAVTFSERPVTAASCAQTLPLTPVDVSGYVPKPWLCGDDSDKTPFWENTGDTRCVTSSAVYLSAAITEEVFRNDCAAGSTAGSVFFTLAAGFNISTVSQQAADDAARAYFDANKQAYANANADCIKKGGVQRNCEYGPDGCFTGFMTDEFGNRFAYATVEECQQCRRPYAGNGTTPCDLDCA